MQPSADTIFFIHQLRTSTSFSRHLSLSTSDRDIIDAAEKTQYSLSAKEISRSGDSDSPRQTALVLIISDQALDPSHSRI